VGMVRSALSSGKYEGRVDSCDTTWYEGEWERRAGGCDMQSLGHSANLACLPACLPGGHVVSQVSTLPIRHAFTEDCSTHTNTALLTRDPHAALNAGLHLHCALNPGLALCAPTFTCRHLDGCTWGGSCRPAGEAVLH
jgi:hypothetical protein